MTKKNYQQSKSKRYVLSFNGEIYNWRELARQFNFKQSQSDAQLLINLFDKISPNKISKKSMECLLLCNRQKKKKFIFFIRRQGKKKLFSFQNDDNFVLSSNINSIINYVGKDSLNIDQIKIILIQGISFMK